MHSLWFVQWDFTRRDHPGNLGRVSGSGPVTSPTNVKTVRQFLRHAGFYRRFIMDFSKIAKPLYKLLEKDAKFI